MVYWCLFCLDVYVFVDDLVEWEVCVACVVDVEYVHVV